MGGVSMDQLIEALKPISETLNADGADLKIDTDGDKIRLEILVSEKTCVECLLPEPITRTIIERQLSQSGIAFESLEIIYPQI
jgi:hypothetical protein